MNVLHVAPNVSRAYGGPTYSLIAYSLAAREAGISVSIAAPRPPDEDERWIGAQLPGDRIVFFPVFGRGAFLASPNLQSWLRSAGDSFDVIHVHGLLNPVSSMATRTCIKRRWPVVVRPFGTLSRYTIAHRRSGLKKAYMTAIDFPNMRRISAVQFTTNVERTESEWHNIDWGNRAFVVPPPWIEVDQRMEHRGPTASNDVVFISRLHPVKNVELLIDAWPLVLQRVPKARLTIAGDGSPAYARSLKERAGRLSTSVRFVGHVDSEAKAQLLADARVFVLPSLHENFGIAVLEALAAGLPVVVTPEVQLSGFVKEHSLGLVADRSIAAFAGAIANALEDRALQSRCHAEGPQLVAHYYSPSAIGEQLAKMYRFAAENPPA